MLSAQPDGRARASALRAISSPTNTTESSATLPVGAPWLHVRGVIYSIARRQMIDAAAMAYSQDRLQDLLAFTSTSTPRLPVTWNSGIAAAGLLPMKQLPINDPAYWRERAEEARRIAEQLADAVAKDMMLDVARSYDKLAKIAEERRRSSALST